MVRLNEHRHRVELQRQAEGLGSRGQRTGVWRTIATLWATVRPLSAAEQEQANRVYPRATLAVELRYYRSFSPRATDRILFAGRVLEIGSAINDAGQNRTVSLLCSEVL